MVEGVAYSASLRDQNVRRDPGGGGPVPDFVPAVPPIQGVWLARANRDELVLTGRNGIPPPNLAARFPRSAIPSPLTASSGQGPSSGEPLGRAGPSATCQGVRLLTAYRVVASIPRALTLDVLA